MKMAILLRLTKWWALIIAIAAIIQADQSYDRMHPPPSQAEVDKVYTDNHDYMVMQQRTLELFIQGMSDGLKQYEEDQKKGEGK